MGFGKYVVKGEVNAVGGQPQKIELELKVNLLTLSVGFYF